MAHISAITAVYHSVMAVSRAAVPATLNAANLQGCFTGLTTNTLVTFDNVRDFPTIGSAANIVKVPVYGSNRTVSIGAQGDAPDYTVKINYVPLNWVPAQSGVFTTAGSTLGDAVADNISHPFMFAAMSNKPTAYTTVAGGLGTVANSQWFFVGRIESLVVNPARDDALTADIQISVQSDLYGPTTI